MTKTNSKQVIPLDKICSFYDLPEGQSFKFLGFVGTKCGAGGAKGGNKWTFSMDLHKWKVEGGPLIQEYVMLVYRNLSELQMDRLISKVEDNSLIAFRARRPKKGEKPKYYTRENRLELESLAKSKTDDPDLQRIYKTVFDETHMRDNVFGELVYQDFWKIFHTRATYRGKEMWVHFSAKNREELARVLELAKPLWKERVKWFAGWREHVLKHAFDRACLRWSGEKELTRAEFLKLLGWPRGVTFSQKNGRLQYKLQGHNSQLFRNPGVIVEGSTIKNFKPC